MLASNLTQLKGDLRDFMFAGDAIFTVANHRTGNYFTYKVQAPPEHRNPDKPVWFVKVLNGPDNHRDYQMIGMLFASAEYVHWNKSQFGRDCPSEVAFVWLVARLLQGNLPEAVHMYHHGYCGRCGALLTTPESIERGLGPVCASKPTLWG